jgi:hypothetical protein
MAAMQLLQLLLQGLQLRLQGLQQQLRQRLVYQMQHALLGSFLRCPSLHQPWTSQSWAS